MSGEAEILRVSRPWRSPAAAERHSRLGVARFSAVQTGSINESLGFTGVPLKGKLLCSLLLLAAPVAALADQLVPAGSVITCTIAEGKISSKTQNVGDPVMCQLGHTEKFGRNSFPYGSYLIGQFAEYKDPGHFVGKGWMELKFDRLVVQPDTNVPISARVVATTSKYPVDKEGRIHGTGHPTRDTIEWLIPVLWPIDLINLPRRGPTPVLPAETKLTLKVLDDFGIPTPMENAVRTPALVSRTTPDEPTYQSYREPAPVERSYAQPVQQQYAPQPQQYQPQQQYQPMQYAPVQQQAPSVYIIQQPAPVIVQQQQPVVYQQPVMYPPPPPPVYVYPYARPRYYRGY